MPGPGPAPRLRSCSADMFVSPPPVRKAASRIHQLTHHPAPALRQGQTNLAAIRPAPNRALVGFTKTAYEQSSLRSVDDCRGAKIPRQSRAPSALPPGPTACLPSAGLPVPVRGHRATRLDLPAPRGDRGLALVASWHRSFCFFRCLAGHRGHTCSAAT
ncbi:hypothetical protein BS78_03G280100 [Paspalum vaginatum]|nr:hypothetical protein BS78_03G280100 [Paspalum vaginatum]